MFENLSERLSGVFNGLTRQGALTEADVATALREVRTALLEADVSLPVVKSFIKSVQRKAVGQAVMRSVAPGQQVIKIVHDEIVDVLSGEQEDSGELHVDNPPAPVLMVGLQGSGKTTTTAKIAKLLSESAGKRVLMASLDTSRPAAMDQLAVLGQQASVDTLPIEAGQSAVEIARRAGNYAVTHGHDVYFLDTAGRLHIDEGLMNEVEEVKRITNPRETLLVVDGLTGQDAVNVAQEFDSKIGISGVVLTRMEGDGRGGAALSMRAVTGKPIKFVGVGERLEAITTFEPERIAGRILGMGDIVALVNKAREIFEEEKAERALRRFQRGYFNLNDLRSQLEAMEKMGGFQSVMSMMPGMGKISGQLEAAGLDERFIRRQMALIDSMTRRERVNPKILQASRRRRIARGAGQEVSDLNRLLKMHRQMVTMTKGKSKGHLRGAFASLFGKSGVPAGPGPSSMLGGGALPGFPDESLPGFDKAALGNLPGRRG